MRAPHALITTLGYKVWIAVRFVFFGIGGVCVMLLSLALFILQLFERVPHIPSLALALSLSIVGGLMLLYGAGEWGRWAFLWVFVSIPISLGLMALLAKLVPALNKDLAPSLPFVAVVAFLISRKVRVYYDRKTLSETRDDRRRPSMRSRPTRAA